MDNTHVHFVVCSLQNLYSLFNGTVHTELVVNVRGVQLQGRTLPGG